MKIFGLTIIVLLLINPLTSWGIMMKPAQERPSEIISVTEGEQKSWTTGVMTEITRTSVVINGREYRLSQDTVIRYPGGKVIKNIETFNATNPAHVRAVISGSTVEEIVIEEIELRN